MLTQAAATLVEAADLAPVLARLAAVEAALKPATPPVPVPSAPAVVPVPGTMTFKLVFTPQFTLGPFDAAGWKTFVANIDAAVAALAAQLQPKP